MGAAAGLDRIFDIAIVGAGLVGAAIAREASCCDMVDTVACLKRASGRGLHGLQGRTYTHPSMVGTSAAAPFPIRLGMAGLGAVTQSVYLPLLARIPEGFAISAVCKQPQSTCDTVARRLPEYPAYCEGVRFHHDRGSLELSFPAPYRLHVPTELVVSIGGSRRSPGSPRGAAT